MSGKSQNILIKKEHKTLDISERNDLYKANGISYDAFRGFVAEAGNFVSGRKEPFERIISVDGEIPVIISVSKREGKSLFHLSSGKVYSRLDRLISDIVQDITNKERKDLVNEFIFLPCFDEHRLYIGFKDAPVLKRIMKILPTPYSVEEEVRISERLNSRFAYYDYLTERFTFPAPDFPKELISELFAQAKEVLENQLPKDYENLRDYTDSRKDDCIRYILAKSELEDLWLSDLKAQSVGEFVSWIAQTGGSSWDEFFFGTENPEGTKEGLFDVFLKKRAGVLLKDLAPEKKETVMASLSLMEQGRKQKERISAFWREKGK
jgi:hypothetical protein